jgi:hypothetical protein
MRCARRLQVRRMLQRAHEPTLRRARCSSPGPHCTGHVRSPAMLPAGGSSGSRAAAVPAVPPPSGGQKVPPAAGRTARPVPAPRGTEPSRLPLQPACGCPPSRPAAPHTSTMSMSVCLLMASAMRFFSRVAKRSISWPPLKKMKSGTFCGQGGRGGWCGVCSVCGGGRWRGCRRLLRPACHRPAPPPLLQHRARSAALPQRGPAHLAQQQQQQQQPQPQPQQAQAQAQPQSPSPPPPAPPAPSPPPPAPPAPSPPSPQPPP